MSMFLPAVDIWAVGIIFLCILSRTYPFFRSPDDLTALAELITVFGSEEIKAVAQKLGTYGVVLFADSYSKRSFERGWYITLLCRY